MAFGPLPPAQPQIEKLEHPVQVRALPDPPALANVNAFNVNVNYNNELAIINQNVNVLVEIIKRKLGNSNQNVNQKVAVIVNNINRAMNTINTNHMQHIEQRIITRDARTNEALVKDTATLNNLNNPILQNFVHLQNYTRGEDSQQYVNTANANEAIVSVQDPVNLGNLITIDMTDLQNDNGSSLNPEYTAGQLDLANNQADINTVQTRLDNCQRLEMLYLMKHEELMKTFVFALNLFDKYQYSIKLLLFVLKNLVIKRLPPRPPINIQLPKPLIRNIKELLKDQQKMQDVIKEMRTVVNNDDIRDISSPAKTNPSSQNLVTNPGGTLLDQATP
jgi:hypothetical protein